MNTTDIGYAIRALKEGKRVTRPGWNGKGMWLMLVEGDDYSIMPEQWLGRETDRFLPWIGMRTADRGFVPWLASQTDLLAEDWVVLE